MIRCGLGYRRVWLACDVLTALGYVELEQYARMYPTLYIYIAPLENKLWLDCIKSGFFGTRTSHTWRNQGGAQTGSYYWMRPSQCTTKATLFSFFHEYMLMRRYSAPGLYTTMGLYFVPSYRYREVRDGVLWNRLFLVSVKMVVVITKILGRWCLGRMDGEESRCTYDTIKGFPRATLDSSWHLSTPSLNKYPRPRLKLDLLQLPDSSEPD